MRDLSALDDLRTDEEVRAEVAAWLGGDRHVADLSGRALWALMLAAHAEMERRGLVSEEDE